MNESQKKQAQLISLRLLAASPKSRRDLAQKLSRKGFAKDLIRETLDQLEKGGLLSDLQYARNLVSRWTHYKPSGQTRILFELTRHGIPPKIREQVLSELRPEDEILRGREIAKYLWERHKKLSLLQRKKRVYDTLARRGFEFQLARDLVEQLQAGNGDFSPSAD